MNKIQENQYKDLLFLPDNTSETNFLINLEWKKSLIYTLSQNIKQKIKIIYKKEDSLIKLISLEKTSKNTKNNEEIIYLKNMINYLVESNITFLMLFEQEEFESAYYLIKKTQKIMSFLFLKTNFKFDFSKYFVISLINEIVFLKRSDLIQETIPIYKETFRYLIPELGSVKFLTNSFLLNKGFLKIIKENMVKLKMNLKILISFSITYSEQFKHKNALKQSEKTIEISLEILLYTKIIYQFYFIKEIQKLNRLKVKKKKYLSDRCEKKKEKIIFANYFDKFGNFKTQIIEKKEYFLNCIKVIDKIVDMVSDLNLVKIEDFKIYEYCKYFDFFIHKENNIYKKNSFKKNIKKKKNNICSNKLIPKKTKRKKSKDKQNIKKKKKKKLPQKIILKFLKKEDIIKKTKKTKNSIDYKNLTNNEILAGSYLFNSTILSLCQLSTFNFEDKFCSDDLKNEILENSFLEKISFFVLSLYIYSTEQKFLEHKKKSKKKFYKNLLNYYQEKKTKKLENLNESEIYLTKAVEISYYFLTEKFPFVNQIFSIYKKFELNLSKNIPEFEKDNIKLKYLKQTKNGFRNTLIIPFIREYKEYFLKKKFSITNLDYRKKSKNPNKRLFGKNKFERPNSQTNYVKKKKPKKIKSLKTLKRKNSSKKNFKSPKNSPILKKYKSDKALKVIKNLKKKNNSKNLIKFDFIKEKYQKKNKSIESKKLDKKKKSIERKKKNIKNKKDIINLLKSRMKKKKFYLKKNLDTSLKKNQKVYRITNFSNPKKPNEKDKKIDLNKKFDLEMFKKIKINKNLENIKEKKFQNNCSINHLIKNFSDHMNLNIKNINNLNLIINSQNNKENLSHSINR